ncbi:tetratricopeptide repeat-containing sensor histidine kinase [Sphingobacterium sp. SRCM116780]|uniref:tetratricopeptide repeat-containing sensor histidine kinase n=1 Tax=Sphingobacterium sp. SRCM116780 TaxID=2907623 RepID=UPI001F3DC146|nr:tetratricopeptide repeat-containing sensor histidine kinase [Sphingobacterium sp. SRCM116780]UIR57546.1 tetratricopeptide repeat-containing sensor histidine kinase [Sphingobacterium sp. SRCM116780]
MYKKTFTTARYALRFTPSNDYYNLSLFNFYIGVYYQGINGDSSIFYLEKSVAYGRRTDYPKRIVNGLERLLYMYSAMDGYSRQRDQTAKEVLHIVDTTHSNRIKHSMYNALTKYYEVLGRREQQMNIMLADLEIYKKELPLRKFDGADSANLGVSYINIGALYLELKQPQKALEYLRPSKIFLDQYRTAIIHYYKNTADAYLQLFQPDIALVYRDSVTNMTKKEYGPPVDRNNNWDIRMLSDLAFADYYLVNRKNDSALLYMNIAKSLIDVSVTDTLTITGYNYKMGQILVAAKDYVAALPYLKSAEKIGLDQGPEQYGNVLRELAKCYSGTGQWQQAVLYYEKYLPIRDSLYTVDIQKSIADAEAKFQNKEKQQQIDGQQKDLGFARKQRLWLITGLLLTGIIATMLVIFYRNKKKMADVLDDKNKILSELNNELEESNQTKAKLFGIIGHDLRTPVKQMYQFLKLQKLNVHNEQEKAERANKMETATESLLEMMEDLLLWSKTQMSRLNPSIKPVVLLPALRPVEQLLQLPIEEKNIQLQNNIMPDTTVMADDNFLQTIYRNLLQNAIKASPPDAIIAVDITIQDGSTILSIQNSGLTFTQEDFEQQVQAVRSSQTLNGLGLQLIKDLSDKMNAVVRFTALANGTRAEVIFTVRS